MRIAIYYTPRGDHPLALTAAQWLGRSPFSSQPRVCDQAADRGVPERPSGPDELVAAPRRYGFHATLKAPFRLAPGCTIQDVSAALEPFCREHAAPPLGPLKIADMGHFLALVPDGPRPGLDALAAEAVRAFEPFRAPLEAEDLARRRSAGLTTRQDRYLCDFGYPYVFDEFRFHMTLTGRVAKDRQPAVIEMLQERFTGLLESTTDLDGLALFVENEPGTDFQVHNWAKLMGRKE